MSKPELSPDAKQLIKEEFDALSSRFQSSLIEISVWNWIDLINAKDAEMLDYSILQITGADIADVSISKEKAFVTVKIQAETRRSKASQAVHGAHMWTFERPSNTQNASWKISGTDELDSFTKYQAAK